MMLHANNVQSRLELVARLTIYSGFLDADSSALTMLVLPDASVAKVEHRQYSTSTIDV